MARQDAITALERGIAELWTSRGRRDPESMIRRKLLVPIATLGTLLGVGACSERPMDRDGAVIAGTIELRADLGSKPCASCVEFTLTSAAGTPQSYFWDREFSVRLGPDDVKALRITEHSGHPLFDPPSWSILIEPTPEGRRHVQELSSATSDLVLAVAGTDQPMGVLELGVILSPDRSWLLFLTGADTLTAVIDQLRPIGKARTVATGISPEKACDVRFRKGSPEHEQCFERTKPIKFDYLERFDEIEARFRAGEISEKEAVRLLDELDER